MNKNDIRKIALEQRLNFSLREINNSSRVIKSKLFNQFDFNNINLVHIFLPIIEKGEINTWLIVAEIFKSYNHVKILIPKIYKDKLKHYLYNSNTSLKRNHFGVYEPTTKVEFTNISEIDIIIIPLLAFDKNGNRVGYGKGYYDKFLVKCNKSLKVGICLEESISNINDANKHDIKLDYCITPNHIYEFT